MLGIRVKAMRVSSSEIYLFTTFFNASQKLLAYLMHIESVISRFIDVAMFKLVFSSVIYGEHVYSSRLCIITYSDFLLKLISVSPMIHLKVYLS